MGKWRDDGYNGHSIPVGGLAYYLSPLRDFKDIYEDPLHAIFYLFFVITVCGFFAKFWIQISGESARDVARKFKDE